MALRDRVVPCTRCPRPCPSCANANGAGAYCSFTPCRCSCHVPAGPVGVSLPECLREVMRLLADIGCDHVDIAHRDGRVEFRFRPANTFVGYTLEVRHQIGVSFWTPWARTLAVFSARHVVDDGWRILP